MNRWGSAFAAAVAAVGLIGASAPTTVQARAAAATSCKAWRMHTVASGLGILESLLPDKHGGMLLSSSTNNAVERLLPNGTVTTIVAANAPGQLVWRGKRVILPTGDAAASGVAGKADGTLELLNPKTGKTTPYAEGLTMPNGLALAGNGAAYVTRVLGSGTGITKIAAGTSHKVTTNWAKLGDTNGIAINKTNTTMYVDQTFTPNAPVVKISMRHPSHPKRIVDLTSLGSAVPKGLDDLIMGPHGILYLPANLGGEVFSVNPKTKQACLIASGLMDPSAIAVGTGHGWRKGSLFVCGFDGTVRELDPPTS